MILPGKGRGVNPLYGYIMMLIIIMLILIIIIVIIIIIIIITTIITITNNKDNERNTPRGLFFQPSWSKIGYRFWPL